MLKELWHHSLGETDSLSRLSECSKLGFLFQNHLWLRSIIIKMLTLHVHSVMVLLSCGSNIQPSCVFSVSGITFGAEEDKSTGIWLHTRHLVSLCKEYTSSLDYWCIICTADIEMLVDFYGEHWSARPASVMFYSDDSTGHTCTFSQVFLQVSKGNSSCSWRVFLLSFCRRKTVLKKNQT